MPTAKKIFLGINLLGGLSVLSSYIFCMILYPDRSASLWGSASDPVITFFVISMFLAALGYIWFTFFLLKGNKLDDVRVGTISAANIINSLYLVLLVCSTIWMPASISFSISENILTELMIRLMITAAIFEFLYMHKTPVKVIIAEYLKVCDYFAGTGQKNFLNAILDKASKITRALS